MAQISPALDTLRHDAGRYRELDVLDRLQQSLPEGYEVFYSVAWQTAHHGEGRHGEIDLALAPSAHIRPFSEAADDDPRNGLVLTSDMHWA